MSSQLKEAAWLTGQRVRNEVEPALGLGIVRRMLNSRTVEVFFPSAQESRAYSIANAPLRRFELNVGQQATARDGRTFRIERVEHNQGLITYHGGGVVLPELELNDGSTAQGPLESLIEGELSHYDGFDLRRQAWKLRALAQTSTARGLMGGRVTLLPHQLAIAQRVSSREYPRVLLADEVGLGKTIEACLIFSALRAVGRADRVLILTPSSLVHQWLTELYRRFNELFRVAHSEWVPLTEEEKAIAASLVQDDDPFEDSTRIIAPIRWLGAKDHLEKALKVDWDLVIVDEAHHLAWSHSQASRDYQCVEALARHSKGLLLLTATPLRQGLETQFALLRLVDPERFGDYPAFVEEQNHLKEVAELARRLSEGDTQAAAAIRQLFPEDKGLHEVLSQPQEALRQLIDRHGTGRVLVRNRRERLGGFPGRELHTYPLERPATWKGELLWPEVAYLCQQLKQPVPELAPPTAKVDPRWQWVLGFVRSLPESEKVVVMTASARDVLRLEKFFRAQSGLKIALFHEGLSLVERDRQAAYFADPEGAQVLLSSEIGGEGRNFQFCHHLVLFDLPCHPDALEQRIGRLDRIGQSHTIQIHVPYIESTPSEALFRWYQELGVFAQPVGGGEHLIEALGTTLRDVLHDYPRLPAKKREARLQELLELTQGELKRYRDAVQQSVDFLVDLNSFHQDVGEQLVQEVNSFDSEFLAEVVSNLLEYFGVNDDDLADPKLRRISPGHLMKVDPFPALRQDGYLATYDRECALAREELQFLSCDHPLVEGAVSLLLDQSEGRASVALWPGAPEQSLWVQFLFVLEATGPQSLELGRYLPPTPVNITLDMKGTVREEQPASLQTLGAQVWARLSVPMQDRLPKMLEQARAQASQATATLVGEAHQRAAHVLEREQQRLVHLESLGTVSARELESHRERMKAVFAALDSAQVNLDAIRVVVLDPRA